MRCECSDPGCPVCHGKCRRKVYVTLYRVDMEDVTGTDMCQGCADDAMDAGVFSTDSPADEGGA
jgi:hypothetical protein